MFSRQFLFVYTFCLLTFSCSDEPLYNTSQCDSACVVFEGETYFNTEAKEITCNTGTYTCYSDGSAECLNFRFIEDEICDGIDNDCNSKTDEGLSLGHSHPDNTCSDLPGICSYAQQVCINSEWTCVNPVGYGQEVCDGIDNNCDGRKDANDPNLVMSGTLFGYDGPIETVNVGECRGYAKKCVNGHEVKDGQILPEKEICGNNKDDDCDGLTDENEDNSVEAAFALYIDISASMHTLPDIIASALLMWSNNPRFAESKFAVIFVGEMMQFDPEGNQTNHPYIRVVSDFTNAYNASVALSEALETIQAGGFEYFPQAILESHNPDSPLKLAWPENLNKHVIAFSDEPPHSITDYETPSTNDTWQNPLVVEDCEENGYKVSAFVDGWSQNEWTDITEDCGGWIEVMSYNIQDMLQKLNDRFQGTC